MVFFFLRKKALSFKRKFLWGGKAFPSIQVNLLLKGFAKTPEGKKFVEINRRLEGEVESILREEPTRKGVGPGEFEGAYAQWFAGIKRAREDQLKAEHAYLVEFCQFAFNEGETKKGSFFPQ
jgi:hypothetical protein